ncbi:PepSY domain-containing protein [Hyphomicrobium sp. D-2]|uniref:PepSY domain-containing protein n=1 Tax=Hyphomicrobium sp. D-2 TaxID=3041621 RepID=UPI0024539872|nr:PepSY domain-containing protein [Hyphomicrobium sp. D-2]MDH4981533.1 PepSY domain-containing protein [Hyphomicrobium sp. D-2]
MQKYIILPLFAAAVAIVTPALAVDNAAATSQAGVPRAEWLSPDQVGEKLRAAGYKVQQIETDDGVYEVELVDQHGTRIEAHVHPKTGEILVGYDD